MGQHRRTSRQTTNSAVRFVNNRTDGTVAHNFESTLCPWPVVDCHPENKPMNYAEDRLDRKARGTGLWDDFQAALRRNDHVLLGRTLRDVGWIRHAVFHYSLAPNSVGDYAQMAELAGFPEIGILALLRYRNGGGILSSSQELVPEFDPSKLVNDPSWLQQEAPRGHCGCGLNRCGQSLCEVNLMDIDPPLNAIEDYIRGLAIRTKSTAHEVLVKFQSNELDCSKGIPELLKFWSTDCTNFRPLSPVVQLLLLKQMYLVIPSLAAEAVPQLNVNRHQMAIDFKSHNAYHVLIQALTLGERIKPSRRTSMRDYHVPVWDLLWGHNCRHGHRNLPQHNADDFIMHLRNCLQQCQSNSTVPTYIFTSWNHKPLFVVGDSHVLSMGWQTLQMPNGDYRTLIPVIVTGLKAWHCRRETRFFTTSLLDVVLQRLPPTDSILFSAGEIDCREGLGGPTLEGYNSIDEKVVEQTVCEFVKALTALKPSLRIWLLPVCPHIHRSVRNGKAIGRAARREVTQLWNEYIRLSLPCHNVHFLDYEKDLLDDGGYNLKRAYNADGTHMNSAFLSCLENAMKVCCHHDTGNVSTNCA